MRSASIATVTVLMMFVFTSSASAQQSVSQVLSFLLTNRSVTTGDFKGDAEAAAATREAIARLIQSELTTVPVNSPAAGFTYRLDPMLGASVRASDSFGPFFTERTLTFGRHQKAFGAAYTHAAFDNIDGRDLNAGTLVTAASRFTGDAQPFDSETLTLRMRLQTLTFSGSVGLTDRLDLVVLAPIVTVKLEGQRVDTYRGTPFVQAIGFVSATRLGDVVVRLKHNPRRFGGRLAFAADAKLPTGDDDDLLGSAAAVTPRVLATYERGRVAVHGNLGYSIGGPANEIDYRGAFTVTATPRVTVIGEWLGRRLNTGRLIDVTAPHAELAGVETVRLGAAQQTTSRMTLVAGMRWNVARQWLLSAKILRPLTTAGLNARWEPTVSVDYSVGR